MCVQCFNCTHGTEYVISFYEISTCKSLKKFGHDMVGRYPKSAMEVFPYFPVLQLQKLEQPWLLKTRSLLVVSTVIPKFAFAGIFWNWKQKAHPFSTTAGTWTTMPLVRIFRRHTELSCMHPSDSFSVLFQTITRENVANCLNLNQMLICSGVRPFPSTFIDSKIIFHPLRFAHFAEEDVLQGIVVWQVCHPCYNSILISDKRGKIIIH